MTKVLFVCLGNICRSPTAEAVFRRRAQEAGLNIVADSAGTSDWHIGEPPDSRAQAEAFRRGMDMSDLKARQFLSSDFIDFDLIIAMDHKNYRTINELRPANSKTPVRLFLEFSTKTTLTEVPDPYYTHGFEGVFDLIDDASQGLISELS